MSDDAEQFEQVERPGPWRDVAIDAASASIGAALVAAPIVAALALRVFSRAGMFNGFAEVAAFCAVVELLSVVPVALATVPFLRALKAGGRSPAREVTLALLAVLVTVVAMSLGAIELLYVLCVIRSHALGQPFASALVEFGRILHMAVTESEARSIILATGGVAALATFVAFVACRRGGAVPKIGALAVTIGAIVAVILVAPDSDVQGIVGVGSGLGAGVLIAVEAGALLRRIVARRFAALR